MKNQRRNGETKNDFHPDTILAKLHMRKLRLEKGLDMRLGAMALNITRKQLEDCETHQPYGCYIDWTLITAFCEFYKVMPNEFIKPLSKAQRNTLTPRAGQQ